MYKPGIGKNGTCNGNVNRAQERDSAHGGYRESIFNPRIDTRSYLSAMYKYTILCYREKQKRSRDQVRSFKRGSDH